MYNILEGGFCCIGGGTRGGDWYLLGDFDAGGIGVDDDPGEVLEEVEVEDSLVAGLEGAECLGFDGRSSGFCKVCSACLFLIRKSYCFIVF
jgi:hypothetical protein